MPKEGHPLQGGRLAQMPQCRARPDNYSPIDGELNIICCTLESKLNMGWCSRCGGNAGQLMLCTARQAAVEAVCLMARTVSPRFEALRTVSLPLHCPALSNRQRTCLPAKCIHGESLSARGRRPRPSCASRAATPIPACSRSLLWRLQPGQIAAQPIHLHEAVQQVLCTVLQRSSFVHG